MPCSPLSPVIGGEGSGVRGVVSRAENFMPNRVILNPLTPSPSPPDYRGRGEAIRNLRFAHLRRCG